IWAKFSNPQTHLRNFEGNMLTFLVRIPEKLVEAGLLHGESLFKEGPGAARLRALAEARARSVVPTRAALQTAFDLALDAAKSGERNTGLDMRALKSSATP